MASVRDLARSSLFPPFASLRQVSVRVAVHMIEAAVRDGVTSKVLFQTVLPLLVTRFAVPCPVLTSLIPLPAPPFRLRLSPGPCPVSSVSPGWTVRSGPRTTPLATLPSCWPYPPPTTPRSTWSMPGTTSLVLAPCGGTARNRYKQGRAEHFSSSTIQQNLQVVQGQ
eukprot:1945818-Rhodomonas_salina.2